MTADFDQARVELDRDVFLRMDHAQGATVACLAGCLWITRDGAALDVELDPGQVYRVEDARPVIVCGFGPSVARLRRPETARKPTAARGLGALFSRRTGWPGWRVAA